MSLLSNKLNLIKPSPTLSVNQLAAELQKQGKDIIALSVGEPDYDTPEHIKAAAIKGIHEGYTKYTNVDGAPELKKAVQNKFKRENDLEYELNEIIIGCGGKQVIYNVFMASLNDGDEVIIPTPYWVSYPDMVLLAGGLPVFANCGIEDNFKLKPETLEKLITNKTKWVIINSPSNPTGSGYSHTELLKLAEILRKYPTVAVMSDDIYEHITFDNFKFYTLAQIAPDLKARIFTINGVSKSYSMTGWRIGYGVGDKNLIKAMAIIQSQSTSNPCSISQLAATEALNGPQDFIKSHCINFQKKRDKALEILGNIPHLQCYKPEGAFYLFPKCSDLFGLTSPAGNIIENSNDLAKYLLEYANVAIVPGIGFGMEGYFRLSYATSIKILTEACNRIARACNELK